MAFQSAELNGTNQFFSITDAAQVGLDFTTALTFYASIKVDNFTGFGMIVSKYRNDTNSRSYAFFVDTSGNLRLRASTQGSFSSSTFLEYVTSSGITVNTWHDVAVTLDVATESFNFYIDGILVSSSMVGGGTALGTALHNGTADFMIGNNTISGNNSDLFDGNIAYVRAWSDVLTATEVANESGEVSAFKTTNLQGDWRLNGDANDASTNGNDLTNNNSTPFAEDNPIAEEAAHNNFIGFGGI